MYLVVKTCDLFVESEIDSDKIAPPNGTWLEFYTPKKNTYLRNFDSRESEPKHERKFSHLYGKVIQIILMELPKQLK